MPSSSTDLNLLFGILALQMDFIRRDDLIAAMNAWVLAKDKSLGAILRDSGRIAADEQRLLDDLVGRHVQKHGNDAQKSLAAVSAVHGVEPDLHAIADADVQASLAHVTPVAGTTDPDVTASYTRSSAQPANVRFRKLRYHDAGGLGVVSVAEDMELHREVALKEIKPKHADNPAARARFIFEAEITGGLEHPGIVPIYGLGVYPDGKPYYAMRLIRGESLRETIERFHAPEQAVLASGERTLAFSQLLRRFVDVCNAVAYAHSRGVLHRDLKPANVMLGNFGETLVVDWGLAKSGTIGPHGDGEAPLLPASAEIAGGTQAGDRLGTLAYSSPEQAAGKLDAPGPASDVYSLGCTLYAVLTGQSPYPGKDSDEVLRHILRGQHVPPRYAKPGTPPALAAICEKAMALAPTDRYATALALAADVEHWLADEPVAAYTEPWTARAGRWARRHRTVLVAALVFLVSAVIALSASTALVWAEQRQTAAQKRVAEENFELARDMTFSGIDLIEASEASFAADPVLHSRCKDLLITATRASRRYLAQQPDDPELRKRAAQIYRFTANVHRLENDLDVAEPLLVDSITLLRGLVQVDPTDKLVHERLSLALRDFGLLQKKLGRLDKAMESLDGPEGAIALATALEATDPERPAYVRIVAAALLARSSVEFLNGKHTQSLETANGAAERFRKLVALSAGPGSHPYDRLLFAAALNLRAVNERELGRWKDAIASHQEAIRPLDAMMKSPQRGVHLDDLRHYLASCLYEQARTWAHFPERRKATEINFTAAETRWHGLAEFFGNSPDYREGQANALRQRGLLRLEDKRLDDGADDITKSAALLQSLVRRHPQIPAYRMSLCKTHEALSTFHRVRGKEQEATKDLQSALDGLDEVLRMAPDYAEAQRMRAKLQQELRPPRP
jgi:tetratricopeptide (TPR) repeat protein/tRNA A-37 threonylcarbamoyl transferase component Bud32